MASCPECGQLQAALDEALGQLDEALGQLDEARKQIADLQAEIHELRLPTEPQLIELLLAPFSRSTGGSQTGHQGMCRKQLPCFPEICYQALRSEPNREEGSMDAYAPEIERKMKRLFDSLSEDDRRRYAAVEATKLGHGGIEYIAQLLQCDPKTIRRGLAELDEAADLDTSRVRKKLGWQS